MFDTSNQMNDLASVVLLTKSLDWEYEFEWRIARQGWHNKIRFDSDDLTAVIFGAETSPTVKQRIATTIQNMSSSIELCQAKPNRTTYEIEIVKYDGNH
jgi:hypothetical protein